MTQTISLAVIPGDGIGPDVVAEGLKVLAAAVPSDVRLDLTRYDVGAARWHATGELLPDTVLAELRGHDAIFFGSIGDPSVPSGLLERGILLRIRFEFDQFVNLRPCRLFPGVLSPLRDPGQVDFVVVREGTEGPYVGNGGAIRFGSDHEVATEVSLNTAYGVQRLVRDAFARASARPRRKLTLVHKHNVLMHAGGLWRRTVDQIAADYPAVTVDYLHVDAASIFLVTEPFEVRRDRHGQPVRRHHHRSRRRDRRRGGLAASGNINPTRQAPSMFEPVHGSAPDIAGQGIADPTATVLSAALMLEHLGLAESAQRITGAVEADLAARGDAKRGTAEIGDALAGLAAG